MASFLQVIGAGVGIFGTGFLVQEIWGDSPNSVPWMVYAGTGFMGALGAAYAHAIWKYGWGVIVRPTRRMD
jgi:hypothetical protein